MSTLSFLSADNRCHSFDQSANGYARGEGGGFLVLKPVSQAIRDGDTIRAVIRGTGSNQDGRTPGITLPSGVAQEELIRATYAAANLNPAATGFFEAHGTGTSAGDPIECGAVGRIFGAVRQTPVMVGSVKAAVGHLEGSSGMVSLIKSIYSLESGDIPPTYGLERINPNIKYKQWNLEIPTELRKWPPGLRRISVNKYLYPLGIKTKRDTLLETITNFLPLVLDTVVLMPTSSWMTPIHISQPGICKPPITPPLTRMTILT